jgi:hypothetical protein
LCGFEAIESVRQGRVRFAISPAAFAKWAGDFVEGSLAFAKGNLPDATAKLPETKRKNDFI